MSFVEECHFTSPQSNHVNKTLSHKLVVLWHKQNNVISHYLVYPIKEKLNSKFIPLYRDPSCLTCLWSLLLRLISGTDEWTEVRLFARGGSRSTSYDGRSTALRGLIGGLIELCEEYSSKAGLVKMPVSMVDWLICCCWKDGLFWV